jgi:hypothetical protein
MIMGNLKLTAEAEHYERPGRLNHDSIANPMAALFGLLLGQVLDGAAESSGQHGQPKTQYSSAKMDISRVLWPAANAAQALSAGIGQNLSCFSDTEDGPFELQPIDLPVAPTASQSIDIEGCEAGQGYKSVQNCEAGQGSRSEQGCEAGPDMAITEKKVNTATCDGQLENKQKTAAAQSLKIPESIYNDQQEIDGTAMGGTDGIDQKTTARNINPGREIDENGLHKKADTATGQRTKAEGLMLREGRAFIIEKDIEHGNKAGPKVAETEVATITEHLGKYRPADAGKNPVSDIVNNTEQPRLDPRQIIDQLVQNARVMSGIKKTSIEIHLKPESLGKVSLKLEMADGLLNGNITVQNPRVQQIIQENLALLKESLELQGLSVGGFIVNTGRGGDLGQHSFRRQNKALFEPRRITGYLQDESRQEYRWTYGATVEYLI